MDRKIVLKNRLKNLLSNLNFDTYYDLLDLENVEIQIINFEEPGVRADSWSEIKNFFLNKFVLRFDEGLGTYTDASLRGLLRHEIAHLMHYKTKFFSKLIKYFIDTPGYEKDVDLESITLNGKVDLEFIADLISFRLELYADIIQTEKSISVLRKKIENYLTPYELLLISTLAKTEG